MNNTNTILLDENTARLNYESIKNIDSEQNKISNKSLLETNQYTDNEFMEDDCLEAYYIHMKNSINNMDKVDILMRNIDCCPTNNRTLYESAILESFILEQKEMGDIDYRNIVPHITPYFTFDNYLERYPDTELNSFQYIFGLDQKEYLSKIRELQYEFKQTLNPLISEKILEMGWNPNIPINGVSIKHARDTQIKYLNENSIKVTEIANISNFSTEDELELDDEIFDDSNIEPVYIVLTYTGTPFGKAIKYYQRCSYTHAGLSLTPTLNKIYSYNLIPKLNINGFSIESLDEYNDKSLDCKLKVLVCFIPKIAKKKLITVLNWFEDHVEKTNYNIRNVFNIVVNKSEDMIYNTSMVCSQFVDSILKMCNIDITNKSSNLVTPKTFELIDKKKTKSALVYTIFEGYKSNYNWKTMERKIKSLINLNNKNKRNIISHEDVVNHIYEYKLENLNIFVHDKLKMNDLVQELYDFIRPEPIITINEINFNIKFNNKGDLIISKKDLQSEYEESHKLLYMYDQTNEEGIKHELAKLFYLNSIIENKIKKMKVINDSEYKELIDLRARILNDFSTYFKILKSLDQNFDFSEYMKNSEYYNRSVVVDNSILKYSGKLIKNFLRLQGLGL